MVRFWGMMNPLPQFTLARGVIEMHKTILMFAVLAVALTTSLAGAQPSSSPDKSPQTRQSAPSVTEFDKQQAQWQEHMKQMQAQMDKIRQTKDPKERQRLLEEHWTAMQAAMSVMHNMWGTGGCCAAGAPMGPGMMGGRGMMGWGHMGGFYSGLSQEQLKQRQYMMEQYVPMQQMMMDHMMWHQYWMSQPASAATK